MAAAELIKRANSILEKDFDICLKTDNLKTYSGDDWLEFQKVRGIQGKDGVFVPGSMTAHVLLDDLEQVLLHEHVSHRVFFENAVSGLELRKQEDELKRLESIIIGPLYASLGEDAVLDFRRAEGKDVEIGKDRVVVSYNPSDALVNIYLNRARQVLAIRQRIEPLCEGFAYWLTDCLSKRLGIETGLPDMTSAQRAVFSGLASIEERQGPITALYSVNTYRSHRQDLLIRLLKENLKGGYDKIQYLFKYGSDKPSSDIDFLAVVGKEEDVAELERISKPRYLDVSFVSRSEFENGLLIKDIHFSVPVLSGSLLKGADLKWFESLLEARCELPDFVEYMGKKKEKAVSLAKKCYDQYLVGRENPRYAETAKINLYRALIDISYAAVYDVLIKSGPGRFDQQYLNQLIERNPDSMLATSRRILKQLSDANFGNAEQFVINSLNVL